VDRRTVIVWATLIGAMTVASGLLLILEPRPLPPTGGMALAAIETSSDGLDRIFQTRPEPTPGRWDRIVITHSGQTVGSAASIGDIHQKLGYGGLQYHFVIGNGRGTDDGLIQVGYLWMHQADSLYADRAITICMVGNGDKAPPTRAQMDQLVRLIQALNRRLEMSADDVCLHRELAQTTSPGRLFPSGLLDSRMP
jgi:hypothetical protein